MVEGVVTHFREKPHESHDLIDGGYFVAEPEILDLVEDDATVFESLGLGHARRAAASWAAYEYSGFWMPMGTLRERDELNRLWQSGNPPWVVGSS